MKNDQKIVDKVKELEYNIGTWLRELEIIGNQCAYTDRCLEDVITTAEELGKLYNENK